MKLKRNPGDRSHDAVFSRIPMYKDVQVSREARLHGRTTPGMEEVEHCQEQVSKRYDYMDVIGRLRLEQAVESTKSRRSRRLRSSCRERPLHSLCPVGASRLRIKFVPFMDGRSLIHYLPRQLILYKSWRRSRRFFTVPLLRAITRVSGRRSAMATVSTFGVVSAEIPSRANGKSHGVKIQLCAY